MGSNRKSQLFKLISARQAQMSSPAEDRRRRTTKLEVCNSLVALPLTRRARNVPWNFRTKSLRVKEECLQTQKPATEHKVIVEETLPKGAHSRWSKGLCRQGRQHMISHTENIHTNMAKNDGPPATRNCLLLFHIVTPWTCTRMRSCNCLRASNTADKHA
jgi:hypothetical protein